MDASELAGQNLNLLVALHALLRERHVSRAAAQLGVSQPAMSRSLGRLRELFDDPLLVRVKAGMQPTPRALELLPQIEAILAEVLELIRPVEFCPATASGTVRVAAPDLVVYMLVPALMRSLAEQAPGLDLDIVSWRPSWREDLETSAIDLCVGMPSGDEPNIYARTLFESDWACVLRKGHPALRAKWTVERFAGLDHLLVSLTGRGGGQIDAALARHGLERHVALRVPYPVLTPLLVAETDLVLTTPRWLARKLASTAQLAVRRPPIPVPPLRAPMLWHERSHRDPTHRWLRDLVARLAGELDPRALRW
ncbi:HTH-type transcriptional regulator SyrM 1 [Enhygromyxa salina]|uniref:HTH-type transcriptional regulator SyrM 1 n=1 Tax=Enhygromyxa salina TaxID=215803 RepID=A0A2S9XCX8_9BACT|nr:LysR family transcriptional regulator [Enhygromyxa salina]PRP90718.1 HTH-type transcriptional regulator SyrM 1 [Enhygromyxa salina]